jgi:type I restriction enzyme S subunit
MEITEMKTSFSKYPAYKDSGVEWLGEIPEHWAVKKMKFLGKIYAGINGKKGDDFSKEKSVDMKPYVPFTNICNNFKIDHSQYQFVRINENENQNRVKKNDILFLMSSETLDDIAKNSIYLGNEKELYLNSFCKGFRIYTENAFPEFLNYLFYSKSYRNYFSLVGRGFTRINLKQEFINDAFTILPSIKEQIAIANFLDDKTAKIDLAIAQKEKMIALLKEHKQIMIQNAVTKGLDPNVKMIESGVEWIGEIPEHWEVKRLKELCKAYGRIGFRGYTTSDLVAEGEGAITISPSNIKEEFMIFEKCSFLSWNKYNESPEIQIFNDDVLMVKTGSTYGKIGIVKNLPQKATINPQLLVFKSIKINADYFYAILKTLIVQEQIETEVIGSTIPTISETKIMNIKVAIPNADEIETIVNKTNEINLKFYSAITLKEQEIEKLKELKSTLIDGAVTGKIKVVS